MSVGVFVFVFQEEGRECQGMCQRVCVRGSVLACVRSVSEESDKGCVGCVQPSRTARSEARRSECGQAYPSRGKMILGVFSWDR